MTEASLYSLPSPDAYSRVTNSGRFRGLHEVAESWIARVVRDYDAEAVAAPIDHVQRLSVAQVVKTVRVIPNTMDATSIAVSFTQFPGLIVALGDSITSSFPGCGCDACNETFDDEADRFLQMVQSTVEGGCSERERGVFRQFFEHEFRAPSGVQVSGGSSRLPFHLRRVFKRRQKSWRAWRRRRTY